MAIEFKLPDLGEGIHEAEVLQVKVNEGDVVKEDQPIFEVETDKAVTEIPSPVAGTIEKIHVQAGQIITVGSVMVTFGVAAEKELSKAAKEKSVERGEEPARAQQGKAQVLTKTAVGAGALAGNGRDSVDSRSGPVPAAPATRRLARELGVDLRQVNGSGPAGRVLNEDVRSYAAGSLEGTIAGARAAQAGTGTDPRIRTGTMAGAGSATAARTGTGPRAEIQAGAQAFEPPSGAPAQFGGAPLHSGEPGATTAKGAGRPATGQTQQGAGGQGPALPRSYGSNEVAALQSLTSKYGDAAGQREAVPLSSGAAGLAPPELPDFAKFGKIERIPLRSVRRKTAQHMTQSWAHIPHVTHFDEVDVTDLERLRAKHEDEIKARGGRLTLTVFAIKAIASGLKKYPQFNASLDERTGELIFKHYYNVGVAVATDRGLIVPVIKDADRKTITELCLELAEIADKTRLGKVELERLQGGTFTVTNIGAIGGTGMVPMVNYPECAILGMAKAKEKPVVREGKIEIGLIMPLALSFDHRIADGAEAAHFVRHIITRLEEPFTFLLEA